MQSITFDESPQIDGRKYVTFRLIDDQGVQHMEIGLYPGNFDPNTILADMGVRWDAMLANAELQQNLEEIAGG